METTGRYTTGDGYICPNCRQWISSYGNLSHFCTSYLYPPQPYIYQPTLIDEETKELLRRLVAALERFVEFA